MVSAVQQFEPHPDNCLATCRLVPRKWHPTRAAEEKESEQREAIVFSSCFEVVVVGYHRVPRVGAVSGEVLKQSAESRRHA